MLAECKWVVLFRRHLCIVPINASSEKKAVSIPISNIQSLRLDKNDNFLFADEDKTMKSAKVPPFSCSRCPACL